LATAARRSQYFSVLSRGSLRVASQPGLLATLIIALPIEIERIAHG